ncbi:MAG: hypothetical protein LBQ51_10530 [Desulfovibrio sp.]|jgi:hypothetical protein|nr:hypothetical protein [Desulfovibrio sp.]
MAKKKKKPVQRNLSLKERLAGHWQAAKWETFAALYLRDPEASSRTPWVQRWPDVLYNCLTKALFINRDLHSAREFASRLLNETGSAAKADIARVALDFLNMRADASTRLSPLVAEEQLPVPWRELRSALSRAASKPKKRGRHAQSPGAALLKKLQTRFAALSGAGTLTPFTNFLQLAQEFKNIAAGTAAEDAARSIRVQAVLLRDLQKKRGNHADDMRDLSWLEKHRLLRELADGSMHPAVSGIWDFFCSLGGRKFGRDWEIAARTLRLAFDRSTDPALSDVFRRVVLRSSGKPRLFWLTQAEEHGRWPEQVRYLLAFLCVCEEGIENENFLRETSARTNLDRIKTVTDIGRARRPESPWPAPMAKMLEDMLLSQSNEYLPFISRLDIPYESQTDAGLVMLALRMGYLKNIRNSAAAHRLPLSLIKDEIWEMLQYLVFHPLKAAKFDELASMLRPDAFSRLANLWILFAVISSGILTVEGQSATPWDRLMEGPVLDILAKYLPADSLPWAFCRLCHGMGRRRLSDDETLRRDFQDILQRQPANTQKGGHGPLADKSERSADNEAEQMHAQFRAGLFVLLTAWPQADSRIMRPLFERSVSAFDSQDLWDDVIQAVEGIKQTDRKKEIIDCVRSVLDAIPRRRMTPGIEYARRVFRDLSKGNSPRSKQAFTNPLSDLLRTLSKDEFERLTASFKKGMGKKMRQK